MTLHWENKLSVGHELLDKQHQTIIRLLNKLKVDANDPYLPQIGWFTLREMLIYADNHLAYEEKIMKEAGYPGLLEHKKVHNYYRTGIENLQKQVEKGNASIKTDVIAFFDKWWEKHIVEEDMLFKPYVEKFA